MIAFIVIAMLFSMSGKAQDVSKQDILKVTVQSKFIGLDRNWNALKYAVNITINKPGRLTYVEEYFTVDSKGNPKFTASKTHFDQNVTGGNISFEILRPPRRGGKFYSMVRGAILLNNKRVKERWLRTVRGAHLTYTINAEEDVATKVSENILKFEVSYKKLIANTPVLYAYTIPDLGIYEIDVVGKQYESDVPLRINLLKGVPYYTRSFPEAVYKYLDLDLDYPVEKMLIRYKVENSWINDIDISEKNIKTFRWNNTDRKWNELKTDIIDKDNNYTYFESEITNITPIIIAGLGAKSKIKNQTKPVPTETKEKLPKQLPEGLPASTEVPKVSGFEYIIGVLALAAIYILKRETF